MKNDAFEMAYKQGGRAMKKFTKAATYLTEKYVSECPDHPLTKEARNTIMECMAVDMATGANLVKNEYLAIGIAVGVTIGILGTYLSTMLVSTRKEHSV
jgi:ElaB/YqjD/DUF883 family membrane-anchored ribosome-binding protein